MRTSRPPSETIVVTGLGLVASLGPDRETVWTAVRRGDSGARSLAGLEGIPDHLLIGAPVEIPLPEPGQLKPIALAMQAATEALDDAQLDFDRVDCDRFGCAVSGHMGDTGWVREHLGLPHPDGPEAVAWWRQWMPNTACTHVANRFALAGPRICHSTACASGLIDVLAAMRSIEDGQCDLALAGSADALHPLFAAGFHAMKVLAHHEDPQQACRPYDRGRNGFVMGEGAGMLVLERLDHALNRGAPIYAELCGGKLLGAAHHVTSVGESDTLAELIRSSLARAGCQPEDIEYINAHGTGTQQNDALEIRGIRQALGKAAERLQLSSCKSMLGHLVNAAGSVELALTLLALRDGFLPPTLNLTDPDPECDLDCIPLSGRAAPVETAMKLSVAFGGHLAAVVARRWDGQRRPKAA